MDAVSLSTTDRTLVRLLQENARRTNKELAHDIGVAESTCLERIRSLVARQVIVGWHAEVAPEALGRSIRALVSVRLQPKTAESVRGFQLAMIEAPETISIATITGADDFIVEVGVPSVDRLRTFVLEVITSRKDVVDTRTSLVYEHQRKAVLEILDEGA